MNIGFTGTQNGMTAAQKAQVLLYLEDVNTEHMIDLHHGDCIGADEQVHKLAKDVDARTIIHPPKNGSKRAFCVGNECREPKEYLVRNHDIVDETEMLFAAPKGKEELRSGTWATIRYARKIGRPVWVFWPSGKVTHWN